MNKHRFILILLGIAVIAMPCRAQDGPTRTITQITGDLYQFQIGLTAPSPA